MISGRGNQLKVFLWSCFFQTRTVSRCYPRMSRPKRKEQPPLLGDEGKRDTKKDIQRRVRERLHQPSLLFEEIGQPAEEGGDPSERDSSLVAPACTEKRRVRQPTVENILSFFNDDHGVEDVMLLDLQDRPNAPVKFMVIAVLNSMRGRLAVCEDFYLCFKREPSRSIYPSTFCQGDIKKEEWVLFDLGHIYVHVMTREVRDYYDIGGLWKDKPAAENLQLTQESFDVLERERDTLDEDSNVVGEEKEGKVPNKILRMVGKMDYQKKKEQLLKERSKKEAKKAMRRERLSRKTEKPYEQILYQRSMRSSKNGDSSRKKISKKDYTEAVYAEETPGSPEGEQCVDGGVEDLVEQMPLSELKQRVHDRHLRRKAKKLERQLTRTTNS